MFDFEVQRCSRHCTASGRELQPGETFYSALVASGAEVIRQDYAADAWTGPPERTIGWWKSQLPSPNAKRMHWAPNDVMLDLLEQTEGDPTRQDYRYVLSLLLVRRRVLRLEETEQTAGGEVSLLYCPRRETTYRVTTVMPDAERTTAIQNELAQLLLVGGTSK